jgi:hypothetical protein
MDSHLFEQKDGQFFGQCLKNLVSIFGPLLLPNVAADAVADVSVKQHQPASTA